tara:strand:+ start:152 stop:298 length:147 start_codon:yes stop_codon:yes gene_type:complete
MQVLSTIGQKKKTDTWQMSVDKFRAIVTSNDSAGRAISSLTHGMAGMA